MKNKGIGIGFIFFLKFFLSNVWFLNSHASGGEKVMDSRNILRVKKNIGGRKIRMEVLNDGEFTTVNPKCYDKLTEGKTYSVKDMILLLLGVGAEIPLKKLLLMREAFLFEKELSYELGLNFESLKFVPYRFGPCSKLLDETLDSMDDLLTVEYSSGKYEIKLNEKGKTEAEKLIETILTDKIIKIRFIRIGWDQLGNKGILKRICTDYPVYVINSEIRLMV